MVIAALWVDVFSAAGASAALIAAAGAVFAAGLYGRRATIEVEAQAHQSLDGFVVAVRPAVRAVGVLRLRFEEDEGAWIRVTEQYQSGDGIVDGLYWDASAVFGQAFVEGGETVRTTTVIDVGEAPPTLIGWRVSFGISVTRRRPSRGSWMWGDQAFVPLPSTTGVG
jgi:hypothetical protein